MFYIIIQVMKCHVGGVAARKAYMCPAGLPRVIFKRPASLLGFH